MLPYYMNIYIQRACYIPNTDKIYVLFVHPGWVGLNTRTIKINEFPPFNYFNC